MGKLAQICALWWIVWLTVGAVAYAALPERPGLAQPLTVRWRYEAEQTVNLTPAVEGERAYVPFAGGTLVALRTTDGSLLWKNDNGGEISCAPAADGNAVFVATVPDCAACGPAPDSAPAARPQSYLRAISRESGVTLWAQPLPAALYGLLVANEAAVFGVSEDGNVYALNKADGAVLWSARPAPGLSSELSLFNNRLYVGSKDGALLVLDAATGQMVWRSQLSGSVRSHIWAEAGTVYAGTSTGNIYALNDADGTLKWQNQAGPSVQAVALTAAGVFVAAYDNSLYCLNLLTGKRLWRQRLTSRLAGALLTAPEGVLFTSLAGDLVNIVNPRDGKPLNKFSLGDDTSAGAAPVFAHNVILITGRKGLLAFSNPDHNGLSAHN